MKSSFDIKRRMTQNNLNNSIVQHFQPFACFILIWRYYGLTRSFNYRLTITSKLPKRFSKTVRTSYKLFGIVKTPIRVYLASNLKHYCKLIKMNHVNKENSVAHLIQCAPIPKVRVNGSFTSKLSRLFTTFSKAKNNEHDRPASRT